MAMDAHGQKAKKREKIVTIIQMQALSQVLPSCILALVSLLVIF